MNKVYLAGPITGLSYHQSESWRAVFAEEAERLKLPIQFFSPLRGKEYLEAEDAIRDSYAQHSLSTPKAIMTRDHWDVKTSNAMVANLLDTSKVSIGTVMEIAWAYAYRIPTIVIQEEGNIHTHSMLEQATFYAARSPAEAVQTLKILFQPR